MTNKYVSPRRLSDFLDNLKNNFAELTHEHILSDITDYEIDDTLSPISTNPVQNRVIDAELEAISNAMGALELAIDEKANSSHVHSWNDLTDKPFGEEEIRKYILTSTTFTFTSSSMAIDSSGYDASLVSSIISETGNGGNNFPLIVILNNEQYDGVIKQGAVFILDKNGNELFSLRYIGNTLRVMGASTNETYTLEIFYVEKDIKILDENFIPDSIARTSDAMEKNNPVGTGSFSMNRRPHSPIGDCSHAEGNFTTASGYCSHTEGHTTNAYGDYSHAEGYVSTASGENSHAEGYSTGASGDSSHAEGYMTIASGDHSHVQGRYNIADDSNILAHIIGNGGHDEARSNAHTLDWEGNAWYQGDVYVGSTSGINKDEGSKKLATEEYVDTSIANLVGTAPESLDTIQELAKAFEDNAEVVEVLNQAITNKADINHVHSWDDLENKPFGEEIVVKVLVEEASENRFEEREQTNGAYFPTPRMAEGEKFIVTFDGVPYSCTAYDYMDSYNDFYTCLGDSRVYGNYDDDGNKIEDDFHTEDVPFSISYRMDDDGGPGTTWYHRYDFYYADTGSHILKIEKITGETTVKYLDEKYIPDTIARTQYIEENFARKSDIENIASEEQVEALYKSLTSNKALRFYCIEDVTIVLNGVSTTYPANSNVEVKFLESDVFEIIPTSDNSILALNAFPGALGTYYSWLEGVKQFSNILFDMNSEDMYSKWSQGNQGAYRVQFAQYLNCIFWSDNPYVSEVTKRTNYTLYYTSQLPLCYSNIPDNTFKAFYLAFNVTSDPNWGNKAYRDSFAKATWATQAFSYYGARTIGIFGHDSSDFNIVLPKDCRGLMSAATAIENAGTFDAVNVTNFGAKSGSWRDAFGWCSSLRNLYIKNLKVNLNVSWSPINYDSIYYIISEATNTNKITISVSPYTYNLLGPSDFELAASKNITIELLTTNYVEDRRLSDIANKADKTEVLVKTKQTLTDEELAQVRKNLRFIGKDVEGNKYTIDGTTYTASANAEIFGDYENNIAIGQWSIAEGSGTLAKGRASHVEGAYGKALNDGCHVEGYGCTASGYWSHAEGEMTVVSSYASHAEGSYCTLPDGTKRYGTAAGYASHVEGGGCHATGSCCHVEGLATTASGAQSHAEGRYTIAAGGAQHVEGMANIEDTNGKYIHIAGNGTFDNRSNAYTLDWDGNGWFAGNVEATAIILRSSTEGSTKTFKLTINDSGELSILENIK